MRPVLLTICLFAAGALFWSSQRGPRHNRDVDLTYRLQVDARGGITVDLSARGLRDRDSGFQLLNGLGLLQDQPAHIEDLQAWIGDRPVPVGFEQRRTAGIWSPAQAAGGETVRLRYRVRPYDPFASPVSTFVRDGRAVVFGYSAFLVPQEVTDYLPVTIHVDVEGPAGWKIWASWAKSGEGFSPATIHDLWSGGCALGDFTEMGLDAGPARVRVLTEGQSGRLGLTVANRLVPVIREMTAYFGSVPEGEHMELLALYRLMPYGNGRSTMIGVSEENAFFCLATADRFQDLEQLTALAVHECLHFYLGGAVIARPEPPLNNAPDMIWLIEGVTEYLTYRLMERAGVVTPDRVDEVADEKRAQVGRLGIAQGLSLAAAARSLSDAETYQLVYSKGFLIARYLDERMGEMCADDAFENAVRELFEQENFADTRRWITPEAVKTIFETRCPGSRALIERYAEGNASVPTLSPDRSE